MSNQVVLCLSDEELSALQSSIGSKQATTPSKQFLSKACFIRSTKALNQAPGYSEVEIVIGHLTTHDVLVNLGLIRRKEQDIDYKIVANIYQDMVLNAFEGELVTLDDAIREYKARFPVL